jgi:uncharacterized damage-inducible protein DinB
MITELFKQEAIRRLDEGLGRIHKCVGMMADKDVWYRPNRSVVSVGNLVLHLTGNVGQWIVSTMSGSADDRKRSVEFDETGPIDRVQLLGRLDRTIQQAKMIINDMDTASLEKEYGVQGFKESGVGIVLHVVEHFNYHVGQITLHTKLLLDVETGYYSGIDLEVKG